MKIYIINSHLLFSSIILASGVTDVLAYNVYSNEPNLASFYHGVNRFATNFFKTLANNTSSNFISSPVGLNILLSMIYFGTRGTTKEQLESSLNLPQDENLTKQDYQLLIDSMNNVKGAELQLANKLFMTDEYELLRDFNRITTIYYKSETQKVDFRKSGEAAVVINNWCANKTNNRIKKIVESNDLKNTELVMVNAIYFKGSWKYKFNSSLTKSKTFYTTENTSLEVPMMYKRANFHWGVLSDLNATYIQLPYQRNDSDEALSMYIICSNDKNGLKLIESNFEKVNFADLRGRNTLVDLYLPKFKIQSEFDLKPTLEKMGISEMFGTQADFSGISNKMNLKVGKIAQTAFIEVNEEGSEAVAVTYGFRLKSTRKPPPPRKFIVDRPYVYAIVHESTSTILFQGHVHNPIESQK